MPVPGEGFPAAEKKPPMLLCKVPQGFQLPRFVFTPCLTSSGLSCTQTRLQLAVGGT